MTTFTHFDENGRSQMVDVSAKSITTREATAGGRIVMLPATFAMIQNKAMHKGDVLEVARIAGIMGAKRTSELIPLCHPLQITGVSITYHFSPDDAAIDIEATVRITAKTGVEMEALTAVSVAALTIYDMCKAVDRAMTITNIRLLKKSGGKSGAFERNDERNS